MTTVLSADWVLPVEAPPIRDGAVVIEDGRIAAVGTKGELGAGHEYPEAAIVPGFVNAHSHLEYAVYSGFGEGLPFVPWILVHVDRKTRIGWDETLASARIGAAECLRSGVTTVGDASHRGASASACHELGLRAIVYLEVFGRTPEDALARFEATRERAGGVLSERVRLGVSPHTPFNISTEIYAACTELGLPMATHFSESEAELEWLVSGTGELAQFAEAGFILVPPTGTSGIRRLADAGLLGPHLTAAHCVQVDDEDIALLADDDVAVAHCPRSNALLGCGIAPLSDLREAGIRVGLGTDSPNSATSFDMFEEMRAAVFAARARTRRADAISATDALELATLGSARALGLGDEIGSLAPGKRADLAVVSLRGSPYLPWEDPAAAVVFGGSPGCVAVTVVDGEIRYNKGEFEWHALRRKAANARSRMLDAGQAAAPLPSR
jgi:cytosine/adenosine deaminase-related metal-dependent hydrolase